MTGDLVGGSSGSTWGYGGRKDIGDVPAAPLCGSLGGVVMDGRATEVDRQQDGVLWRAGSNGRRSSVAIVWR